MLQSDVNPKVDEYIKNVPEWQGKILAKLRELIHEVDPEIQEDWKWDVPVFIHKQAVDLNK